MKKLLTILAFISTSAFATPNLGVGVLLGDPSALSGKYFMGPNSAIDGGISFGHHELVVFADVLKHFPGKLGNQNAFVSSLNPYVGVGPLLAFSDGDNDHNHHVIPNDDDDYAIGGRIPIGVEWVDKEIPVGVSLEIAPGAVILPDTNAFIQGGVAVRYYF
jgi:hypothetical protein